MPVWGDRVHAARWPKVQCRADLASQNLGTPPEPVDSRIAHALAPEGRPRLVGYHSLGFPDIYENPRGNASCQGKLSYCGPISPRSGGWPRIKLDLPADERVVLPPVRVAIFHPYSDAPADGIT